MYSVYGDGICIYNDLSANGFINGISPKLSLKDNTAGTFEITLPVGNAGYDVLERLSSEIVVKRYDDEIWAGRIISEKLNFQNSRILTCEGELAYLNDTTQPPFEYTEIKVEDFLHSILDKHNLHISEDKQIEVGAVTFDENIEISCVTNDETTMAIINEQLLNKLGGHIRIRRVYDEETGILHKYFDYLADFPNTNAQEIQFGKNLLDFTCNWDMSDYATVILPRGAKLDTSPIESIDAYVDVSGVGKGYRVTAIDTVNKQYTLDSTEGISVGMRYSVKLASSAYNAGEILEVIGNTIRLDHIPNISLDTDTSLITNYLIIEDRPDLGTIEVNKDRSRHVKNEDAISIYGWKELVIDWEDITEPLELLEKAESYLRNEQFDEMVIEVSAVDLRYLSKDVQPINLLDKVWCISRPHGMNKEFPVTELTIQLDKPENSTYTLGNKFRESTLTASTRSANEEILTRIDELPKERTILDKAQDNATAIMNLATQGYVTVIKKQDDSDFGSQSLIISDKNANSDAYDPSTDTWDRDVKLWKWSINGLGYSYDGGRTFGLAITMDGSINADYITTGTLSANRIRTGILEDYFGNTSWNLETGILTMKKGSITLGITDERPDGLFSVNDEGYLKSEYGKIGGFVIDAYSIKNDIMRLGSTGLSFYLDDNYLGTYGTQPWKYNSNIKGMVTNLDQNGYISWNHVKRENDFIYEFEGTMTADEINAIERPTINSIYQSSTAGTIGNVSVSKYGYVVYTANGWEIYANDSYYKIGKWPWDSGIHTPYYQYSTIPRDVFNRVSIQTWEEHPEYVNKVFKISTGGYLEKFNIYVEAGDNIIFTSSTTVRKFDYVKNKYDMKFMYTTELMLADVGKNYIANRLHLGAYLQVDHYGLSYTCGSSHYATFSLMTSGGSLREVELPVDIYTAGGGSDARKVQYIIKCYICNGLLMIGTTEAQMSSYGLESTKVVAP